MHLRVGNGLVTAGRARAADERGQRTTTIPASATNLNFKLCWSCVCCWQRLRTRRQPTPQYRRQKMLQPFRARPHALPAETSDHTRRSSRPVTRDADTQANLHPDDTDRRVSALVDRHVTYELVMVARFSGRVARRRTAERRAKSAHRSQSARSARQGCSRRGRRGLRRDLPPPEVDSGRRWVSIRVVTTA